VYGTLRSDNQIVKAMEMHFKLDQIINELAHSVDPLKKREN
jgi:hypothetical protein